MQQISGGGGGGGGGGGDSISNKISDMDWSIGGYHSTTRSGVRFGSSSSQTSQNSGDICRICHCESEPQNPLLTPCYCSGSLKYVHQSCLQQWLTASETTSCELCKFPFIMHTKIKPFNEWRALQMSGIERRRLFCSVLFHCAAATCVIWSLCVLIERATEEVKRGLISWPFWTKLVVVTVGLTGGIVFMYIQCKAYLSLCTRWRARNRILLIQNAPEKIAPPPSQQQTIDLRDSPPLQIFNRTTAMGTPGRLSNTSGGGMGATQVSTMALNRSVYSAASHGQIVANIESNGGGGDCGSSSRQSRDWTGNVYVEDMGGFQSQDEGGFRCVEPEASSKASGGGNNLNMFKVHHQSHVQAHPQAQSQLPPSNHYQHHQHQHQQHHPYQAQQPPPTSGTLFMDSHHHDILSDSGTAQSQTMTTAVMVGGGECSLDQQQMPSRSKFSRQRHSLWLDSATAHHHNNNNSSSSSNQSDFRRYSDTRLIMEPQQHEQQQQQQYEQHQIFNVATAVQGPIALQGYNNNNHSGGSQSNQNSSHRMPSGMDDGGGGTSIDGTSGGGDEITDILFESAEHGSSFDPLELNIQELLELDIRTNVRGAGGGVSPGLGASEFLRGSQMSVNSDPQKYYNKGGEEDRGGGARWATSAEQKHLLTPQSLPNLSASSENLLMQQQQQQQKQHHQNYHQHQ